MAGRRPKPTVLKLITGNPGKRAINRDEPNAGRITSGCPEHLHSSGKEAWNKLSVLLDSMGVLTEADTFTLERLCDCYTDILECRILIEQDGRTYTVIGSDGNAIIKHNPAVAQLRAADSQFKSYLVEFGLTPAARSKVKAEKITEDKTDPLAKFFK